MGGGVEITTSILWFPPPSLIVVLMWQGDVAEHEGALGSRSDVNCNKQLCLALGANYHDDFSGVKFMR